jgi:outer membrane lipoprotein SlyB
MVTRTKAFRTATLGGLMVTTALGLTGCASSLSGDSYSRTEARRVMNVKYAVVEAVRPVKLEGTKTAVGPLAGAAVGGVAGSSVGQGKGAAVAAVIGAVAGGLAGAAIEEGTTRKPGVEVTLRMESGSVIAVVQEDSGENFQIGESVRVLEDGGTTRVAR